MKLLNLKSVFVSEVSWLLLGHLLLQISFLSPLNSFLYQDIWWVFFSQAVSCLNGPFRQISPILASSLPCLSILNVHAPLVPTSVAIALLSFPPTFDAFLAWLSHDFRCVTLHLTFCVGSFKSLLPLCYCALYSCMFQSAFCLMDCKTSWPLPSGLYSYSCFRIFSDTVQYNTCEGWYDA